MTMTPANQTEIADILRASRRVLAFTHVAPDGDAIGSLLGFGWILKALRPVSDLPALTLVCADAIPVQLRFLPGSERIVAEPTGGPWDVVVALDASDPQRLGPAFLRADYGAAPLIVIDHHITNLHFGALNWVDAGAAATAQIVAQLAEALHVSLGPEAATCLLAGLVTDTRGLRTSNVTLDVMTTATQLMRSGASLADITERTLNYQPLSSMRLWGHVLSHLHLEDHVIWASISQELRSQVAAPDESESGLVSFLLSAPEANISAVFNEKAEGQVEVSLRARPGFDVSAIALSLGGGGHPQAAGCTISGPLATAAARVVPLLVTGAAAAKS